MTSEDKELEEIKERLARKKRNTPEYREKALWYLIDNPGTDAKKTLEAGGFDLFTLGEKFFKNRVIANNFLTHGASALFNSNRADNLIWWKAVRAFAVRENIYVGKIDEIIKSKASK